ncbi:MAG: UDP-N-acetylmuramoyl-L-alanine--D-glutamate ligase [Anaerolineae bacterium]|nr:UDP-N-acetylmuramoyl-L-alanine--D-glutamate ligase [Anaerolineae bacterium]
MNSSHDPLYGKRVVVIGFARQGKALARWLPTIGANVVVSDSKTAGELNLNPEDYPDVEFVLGSQRVATLKNADLVLVSGGVPLTLPIIKGAIRRGIPLANDAQLFLERCPAPVLGITGSAGKTTTTSLTGSILNAASYKTWVGGNIGEVLLDVLPNIHPSDFVAMELSSFQLELMTVSPDFACITNITPNHLDRHGTMEAYTRAKANIFLHQKEPEQVVILNRDDAISRELAGEVRAQLAWFSLYEMIPDGAFLAGNRFILSGLCSSDRKPHVVGDRSEVNLRGEHNLANVLAACALASAAGVKSDVLFEAVRAFRGVPHRLEIVRTLDGITYVNDSIATAPERVAAALRSFDEPLILLLGGRDKKLPWDEMLALALEKSRQIIVFGEVGPLVMKAARKLKADPASISQVATLDAALVKAVSVAHPGDMVLLSPGGTSYDAYVDFAARGEHFRALVNAL